MDVKILVFPSCSQLIPSLFSYVPNHVSMMFPKSQMCSSKVFTITIHFIPYPLPKFLPFTYENEPKKKKEKPLHLHIKSIILREFIKFLIFLGDGSMKITHCKRKNKTWDIIHLMNWRGQKVMSYG
jgi:hypothetical protein